MEAAKQFDNVTWADLGIVDDELTVCDHDEKSLKYKDLQAVCSQLKIWGVKNATKEQTIKKLVFMHQVKTRYGKTLEEGVLEAFHCADPMIDNLHFGDDEVLLDLHYNDFKKIVPHGWKELHLMWKQIYSDYKSALSRFTTLGTHSSDFFDFCEGRPETYYLR